MSRRGWQANGISRYLTSIGEGKVAEYLGEDRYSEYASESKTSFVLLESQF